MPVAFSNDIIGRSNCAVPEITAYHSPDHDWTVCSHRCTTLSQADLGHILQRLQSRAWRERAQAAQGRSTNLV